LSNLFTDITEPEPRGNIWDSLTKRRRRKNN